MVSAWLEIRQRNSYVTSLYVILLPLLSFSCRFSFLCSLTAALASGVSFTSAYLGRLPVVVMMSRVLHVHFDLDYLGRGPPCGLTAALS